MDTATMTRSVPADHRTRGRAPNPRHQARRQAVVSIATRADQAAHYRRSAGGLPGGIVGRGERGGVIRHTGRKGLAALCGERADH